MNYCVKLGAIMNNEKMYKSLSTIVKEIVHKNSLNESSGPSGQDWEALIAVALTNPKSPEKLPEWKTAQKYWGDDKIRNEAMKLAKTFRGTFGISRISQLGDKRSELSPKWKQWGGTNNTPKTDLISNQYHISLKKVGGSQLISGLAGEMQATFNAAKELMGGDENLSNATIEWIDGLGEKMIKLSYKGYVEDLNNLEEKAKQGKIKLTPEQVKQIAEKNQAQATNKILTEDLKSFFEDIEFRNAFCFEAVTGNSKFASREPVANELVEFNPENGSITKRIAVTEIGDVSSIANSTKFYFSFKTSSGQASVALRTAMKKNEGKMTTFSQIIKEEYSRMNSSVKNLVEGYAGNKSFELNEFSILDGMKKLSSYAKENLPKLAGSIVNFFKRIAERIKSAIDSIKQYGKKMVDAVLEFFGIEVNLERVEGEVNNWW